MEIPAHLDHPTFEERVHYLEEYWSNDVKYAFVSFRLGLDSLDICPWALREGVILRRLDALT